MLSQLEDPVFWSEESALPLWLQWFFAATWVLMLASIPFIIPVLSKKSVTKTQIGVGAAMLVVVLGGFYLFTNIILFQSGHFKRVRPLTVVECIYFMSQVITTVGYGDITPAKIRGQVFVGLYVLGALSVIAMLISDLTKNAVELAHEYKTKRIVHTGETPREIPTINSLFAPEKPSTQPLLVALGWFFAIDVVWIAFFSLHPGEGKTVFQAIYMSVITLSSVGLGYFTPVTEAGMIFGAFFMLLGTSALVNVISSFTELMVKLNEWENFNPESKAMAMETLKGLVKTKDEVTEAEFFEFALLQTHCVNKNELNDIREAFASLNPKTNGAIDMKVIQEHLSSHEVISTASNAA